MLHMLCWVDPGLPMPKTQAITPAYIYLALYLHSKAGWRSPDQPTWGSVNLGAPRSFAWGECRLTLGNLPPLPRPLARPRPGLTPEAVVPWLFPTLFSPRSASQRRSLSSQCESVCERMRRCFAKRPPCCLATASYPFLAPRPGTRAVARIRLATNPCSHYVAAGIALTTLALLPRDAVGPICLRLDVFEPYVYAVVALVEFRDSNRPV